MVRISKTSSNGVRILLDIACHSLDAYVRGQDIAACQGIPYKFVDNILQKMKVAGLVRSIRGPKGGYTLARRPQEIRVGDVIRATKESTKILPCGGPCDELKTRCKKTDQCVARDVWYEASRRLAEFFDSVTIGDLCEMARIKK